MKKIKNYILIIIGFIMVGVGAAFTIKANIGMGAYDAISKTISDIVHMKIGTMAIIVNTSCVLGQFLILRKDFKPVQVLQVPLSVLLGTVINFVYYNLLTFEFNSFIGGIIMYVLATLFIAFGVAIVMAVNEVTLALEGFCLALTRIIPKDFAKIRQYSDFLSLAIVTVLTLIFKLEWSIGLGTIIGAIIFGPVLGIYMKILEPILGDNK